MSKLTILFFIFCSLLFAASLAYCIVWVNTSTPCLEESLFVTIIMALNTVIYGMDSVVITALIVATSFLKSNAPTTLVVLGLSGFSLVSSAILGVVIIIKLSFNLDPYCMMNSGNAALFYILWVIIVLGVLSSSVTLIISLFSKKTIHSTSVSPAENDISRYSEIDPTQPEKKNNHIYA